MMKRVACQLLIAVVAVAGPVGLAVTPTGANENADHVPLTIPAQFTQSSPGTGHCHPDRSPTITARVEAMVATGNAVIGEFKDPACSQMNSIVEYPAGRTSTTFTFKNGFFYQFSGDATATTWRVNLTPDQ